MLPSLLSPDPALSPGVAWNEYETSVVREGTQHCDSTGHVDVLTPYSWKMDQKWTEFSHVRTCLLDHAQFSIPDPQSGK